MDKQHFVYALDCGTYDADGNKIIIFGRSTIESFARRYKLYNTSAPMPPILLGAIPCKDLEHAKDMEHYVKFQTKSYAFITNPRVELRKGSEGVLNLIETEMVDGEEFLGMPAEEFANKRIRQEVREKKQQIQQKDPDYWKRYRQDPRAKKRRDELSNERRKSREYKDHRNAYRRERRKNNLEYRERCNAQQRASKRRRKRGGNAEGQLTIILGESSE